MKWKPFFYAVLAGILAVFVVFLLNGFVFEWAPSIGIFLGIAMSQLLRTKVAKSEKDIGCVSLFEKAIRKALCLVSFS
jgi:hypothetical protein